MLIIGMLIGSIITTGVFLVLKNNERSSMPQFDSSRMKSRDSFNIEGMDSITGEKNEESKEE